MQKEQTKLRLVDKKVCPTCQSSHGIESELTTCPCDGSLLCPVAATLSENAGHQAGSYKIERLLGQGANGQVFLAYHESLPLPVAIKVPGASLLSNPSVLKRFQIETESLLALAHENVTQVLDYGVLDDGRPFIVMEYVDGKPLSERLLDGQLKEEECREICVQVARAMAAAHNAGVLHRDLKPSNIMIDSYGNVKVVDFGLSKFSCQEETSTAITKTGLQPGTPAYMSPEQCLGKTIDARSDIYSLGCIMYECLTGRKVFDEDNIIVSMHRHAFSQPKKPSSLVQVKKSTEEIIMACLAKEPKNRPESMELLEALLIGKARLARPLSNSLSRILRDRGLPFLF